MADTPPIPGSTYRVHDLARPVPPVVKPAAEDGGPPSDAVVLFDGKDLAAWEGVDRGPARWRVERGVLEIVPGAGNIRSRALLGDCQLHLEWAAPAEVRGDGQDRGNSGVFLMGAYEVQILDGHRNDTYADGSAAAVYGQFPPIVNACRAPGEWQTYDLVWIAPRFEGERLLQPARLTLFHNGLVVHHGRALLGPTLHEAIGAYAPHPPRGPVELQDHGQPVRFRNIWARSLDL
ncbi:MAG: DUF1080 domain-containing protein [Elusimicrobia bacterium]|nr:DUF1080 domain-containing protein [Elusimicrobiota bacterium]